MCVQVMAAGSNPPVGLYAFFLTSLLETVRINIGECAAASYASLTLKDATRVLMFNTEEVRSDFGACFWLLFLCVAEGEDQFLLLLRLLFDS